MSRQKTTFGKLQRERDKQAKAKAKRERRLAGPDEQTTEDEDQRPVVQESAEVLMELIADVHRRFDNKEISFEDFEERKADLLRRLPIE